MFFHHQTFKTLLSHFHQGHHHKYKKIACYCCHASLISYSFVSNHSSHTLLITYWLTQFLTNHSSHQIAYIYIYIYSVYIWPWPDLYSHNSVQFIMAEWKCHQILSWPKIWRFAPHNMLFLGERIKAPKIIFIFSWITLFIGNHIVLL